MPEATSFPESLVRSQVAAVFEAGSVFTQRPETVKILIVVLTTSGSKVTKCWLECLSLRQGLGRTRTPDKSFDTCAIPLCMGIAACDLRQIREQKTESRETARMFL